jgi:ABC-type glycerol-3-phosphate transport system permease component
MYETIKAVPKEMSEAARIDGASEFRIMSTIVLPIVAGMVGAIFLITFIAQWNEFQFALMYMPTHPTLSYGLYMYNKTALNEVARSVPLQLSGCVIILLPILVLFICFRKNQLCAPLVNQSFVLFLNLKKHLILRCFNTVTAQPEFLFVRTSVNGFAD